MSRVRVLVVEDERITARDIQATLHSLGYEVPTIAETMEEALNDAEELKPDLVLMDIRLAGGGDGIEAADEIRRRFDIPIVYLTAYTDPETVERATRTEAYGYLLKPYSEQELHITLQLALYKSRAERTVKESEERFRKLVENASDMITVLDASGTIIYKGPSVRRLLGYQPEELIGKTLVQVVHPDEREAALNAFRRCLENPNECEPVEYRVLHKNRQWRVMEARGTNRLDDPAVRGIVLNSRDITERKEAEAAIRAAKEEAERASRAKTELLARASHELRTPLNAILGFGQLLETDRTVQDQESVEQILVAGRHLLALVDEVLDLATIDAGRVKLSLEPVSISEVLRQSLDLVRHLAGQRQISIRADEILHSGHHILADPLRMKQVLTNLLSNAIKYNHEGGSITVLYAESPEGHCRIGVRDTGPGIPEEQLGQLFVPFERLNAERRGVKGVGLGLALSRGLLEAMGGTITVESVEGQGSTFWVELPGAKRVVDDVPGPAAADAPPEEDHEAPIVLYIEDNLANIRLVERIVAKRPQLRLLPALTGSRGLQKAQAYLPELILLDLMLPDISGEEVLQQLKRCSSTTDIPVAVLSADAHPEQIGRFLALGASTYLTKPLSVNQLLMLLDERLQELEGQGRTKQLS